MPSVIALAVAWMTAAVGNLRGDHLQLVERAPSVVPSYDDKHVLNDSAPPAGRAIHG